MARLFPVASLLAAVSTAACAAHHASTGLVLGVDRAASVVTISHDAFPGFMDAMAMPFDVRGAARSVTLTPGDRVRFRLAVKGGRSWVDRVEVVSAPAADAGLQQTPATPVLVPVGATIPDFELVDQTNAPVSLSALHGKVVAVTFIYSRCPLPDYCPRMVENFRAVRDRFAARMNRDLELLTISFDPKYDTPSVLARYAAARRAGGPGWRFLTGDPAKIERVCNAFGIQYWPEEGLITHSLQTAVIDRDGRLAATVEGKDFTPQQLGDLIGAVLDRDGTGAHRGFDGIWNSATATPLERPPQWKDKAFFSPEEAAAWERQVAENNQEEPPRAGSKNVGTGTYNTVYREFGTRSVKTLRTSIVTDPPDGRIPALTPAAAAVKRRRVDAMKNPAGAEETGLQDQCLAFATAGPPMLPYSYNSNYQIMQTKDAFVVHAEMIHDARIIHLDGRPHLPPDIRLWMGDSVGRWEGATLVVDTTNFNDGGGFYGDAGGNFGWDRNLHLVERFSLLDADTLLYRFEIDDPTAFTQPWKGELTMARSPGPIYEFACHEGNYALTNMLRGYRASERQP